NQAIRYSSRPENPAARHERTRLPSASAGCGGAFHRTCQYTLLLTRAVILRHVRVVHDGARTVRRDSAPVIDAHEGHERWTRLSLRPSATVTSRIEREGQLA